MKVLVCGSGPGGMAIAAHMVGAGREVTIADLREFPQNVAAIAARGGVEVRSTWSGIEVVSVAATHEVDAAVAAADLVVVSVPAFAHERWVAEVIPSLLGDATLLFMGEGGGSLVARRGLVDAGRSDVLVGETNCLPLIGRAAGPGAVTGDRKSGGVLLAAVPASRTSELMEMVRDVWPFIEPAGSVFETTLVNYDAIDTVPVALVNAGTLEGRRGGVLLWGEGATPSVIRLVEALDGELFALRRALGGQDPRRYRDFLVAQGLAPDVGDLYEVMRAGGIVRSYRPSGSTGDLEKRLALECSWSLTLASSIARAADVVTPVIDGLIDVASAMLGRDLRAEGRTLASLGLDGLDAGGLRAAVA
jgi:opine dehydrogenase